jgi:hypothetical protein
MPSLTFQPICGHGHSRIGFSKEVAVKMETRRLYDEAVTELAEHEKQLLQLQHRVNALRKVVEGLVEYDPALAQTKPKHRPYAPVRRRSRRSDSTTHQAVMKALESAGRYVTTDEVVAIMTERDYVPDAQSP